MNDTATIEFDERDWPLLVIRFDGTPTDAEFAAYLSRYEKYLERSDRYGLSLVTKPSAPMTKAKHARMQAAWINEHFDRLRDRCVGLAFVLPSPMTRGVLKAILSMQRLPVQHSVHATESDAHDWIRAQLEADRVRTTGS